MTGRNVLLAALVVAVAIIGVLWWKENEANRRLGEQADSSRRLVDRLNRLEVENLRLSNIVAQANAPLADAQLAELDSLRREVQSLRRRTNDVAGLEAEVRRMSAELSRTRDIMASNAPPDVPPEDIYPRDNWTFAGYDTPEAALETATWAISQGDEETYMESLAPALQDEMELELGDGDFSDMAPMEMSDATGYRIVDREPVSGNEETITIYMDGDRSVVSLTLINTGNGWRIEDAE
ncbi:MAG TPA: hypothetical protein VN873_04395 [Candidatus Angelobacter sp.]|nr:hypothetical protein [Candidatus Angelobacter sp.]